MIPTEKELEDHISRMKHDGANVTDTIKSLCGDFGMSLSDAKYLVHHSESWSAERPHFEELHDAIASIFEGKNDSD